MNITIFENIEKEKQKRFMSFLRQNCNKFSIENEYTGRITRNTYYEIQQDLRHYFQKEDKERRAEYEADTEYRNHLHKILFIKKKKQALKYFDDLNKENESILNGLVYKECEVEDAYTPVVCDGFINNRITRIGGGSVGGLYNILYYKLSALDIIVKETCDLFDYIYLGNEQFWDLAFYDNQKVVVRFSTDRKEVNCYFTETQSEEFKALKIYCVTIKRV